MSSPIKNSNFLSQLDFGEDKSENKGIKTEGYSLFRYFLGYQIGVQLPDKKVVYLDANSAKAFLLRNPSLSDPHVNGSVAVKIQELATATLPNSEQQHQKRLQKMGFLTKPKQTVKTYKPKGKNGSKLTMLRDSKKMKHLSSVKNTKIGLSTEEAIHVGRARAQPQLALLERDFKEVTYLFKDYLPEKFNLDLKELLIVGDTNVLHNLIKDYKGLWGFSDEQERHIRSSLAELQTLYPATDPYALDSKQDAAESSSHPHETLTLRRRRREREETIDTSDNSNKKDGPRTPPQGTGD